MLIIIKYKIKLKFVLFTTRIIKLLNHFKLEVNKLYILTIRRSGLSPVPTNTFLTCRSPQGYRVLYLGFFIPFSVFTVDVSAQLPFGNVNNGAAAFTSCYGPSVCLLFAEHSVTCSS